MLSVALTIDTEYSVGLFKAGTGRSCDANFSRCLECKVDNGAVGIGYQMGVLERHGLTGVFFVDPMPALVWGNDAIRRIVQPVLERGHDVQLHLHPEWLEFAERNPLGGRTGRNLADFSISEQRVLMAYAIEQLIAAGAPAPVAFRAGNYGANDDTLRVLAEFGIPVDTSFAPGLPQSACAISLPADVVVPVRHCGTIELPIGAIAAERGERRHAQLTAMSLWELTAAVGHAANEGWPALVLVSHSFEMMNRDRGIANRIVRRRFERFCAWLADEPGVRTTDFRDRSFIERISRGKAGEEPRLLAHNPLRTVLRMGEQLAANALYG